MLESEPIYFVICDSCKARHDDGEFAGWTDKSSAREMAEASEWKHSDLSDIDHCPDCNHLCQRCGHSAGDDAGERDYLCTACEVVAGTIPTVIDVSETLLVGRSESHCGNCGESCNPHSKTHDVVLGYGERNGTPGCGVQWLGISSTYLSAGCVEDAKRLRPDLHYVGGA